MQNNLKCGFIRPQISPDPLNLWMILQTVDGEIPKVIANVLKRWTHKSVNLVPFQVMECFLFVCLFYLYLNSFESCSRHQIQRVPKNKTVYHSKHYLYSCCTFFQLHEMNTRLSA